MKEIRRVLVIWCRSKSKSESSDCGDEGLLYRFIFHMLECDVNRSLQEKNIVVGDVPRFSLLLLFHWNPSKILHV